MEQNQPSPDPVEASYHKSNGITELIESYNRDCSLQIFSKNQSIAASKCNFFAEDDIREDFSRISRKPESVSDHRDSDILQRKLVSNLKLQMNQTMERLRLNHLNILKIDIQAMKKSVMEAEISIRRLRIQKRSYHKSNKHNIEAYGEYFSNQSKMSPSFRNNERSVSRSSKLSSLHMVRACSQEDLSDERRNVLRARMRNISQQIQIQRDWAATKANLIEMEVKLLQEQIWTLEKEFSNMKNEISSITKVVSSIRESTLLMPGLKSKQKRSYTPRKGQARRKILSSVNN